MPDKTWVVRPATTCPDRAGIVTSLPSEVAHGARARACASGIPRGTGLEVSSCARSPGRGALQRCPALTGAVLGLLLLGGCAFGGADEGAALEPRAGLARKAVLAAVNRAPGGPASGGKSAATVEPDPGAAEGGGSDLANVEDPTDDQGDGPRYADLTAVRLADSDGGLAVSLALRGIVPGRLARRELMQVGVDLFRVSPLEMLLGDTASDYQIRLQGGVDGWRAFLRQKDGYVPFPGTFTVSGRTLHVVLPWEALGGRKRAVVEAYVDWSSGVGRLSTDGLTRVQLRP